MCSDEWKQERNRMLHLCNMESRELTRACIEDALLRLLQEKNFKDISVTDIAAKAGVSRGAYYRNYESKEDVFRCIVRQKFQSVYTYMREREQGINPNAFWCGMFEGLLKDIEFYKLAVQIGQEIALLEHFNPMSAQFSSAGRIGHYEMLFYTGAAYNVIVGWIRGGAKESPQTMADILTPLMEAIQ